MLQLQRFDAAKIELYFLGMVLFLVIDISRERGTILGERGT